MTREELKALHKANTESTKKALEAERIISRMEDLQKLRKLLLGPIKPTLPLLTKQIVKMDLDDLGFLSLPLFEAIQNRCNYLETQLDQL